MLALVSCNKADDQAQEGLEQDQQESPSQEKNSEDDSDTADSQDGTNTPVEAEKITVKSLKGATSMAMAKVIMDEKAKADSLYDFEVVTMAPDIVQGLAKGEVDIAAIPANLAATLYNQTQGNVVVASTNALNVLYIVDNDTSIQSVKDLAGRTIYATGQGQTPEYVLAEVLRLNDLTIGEDVNVEFRAEATEIANILATEEGSIALLPQPFATVAQTQNDKINFAINLNDLWKEAYDTDIVTGVLVFNKTFLRQSDEKIIDDFLEAYKESIDFLEEDVDKAAAFIEDLDIVKAAIAKKALPYMEMDALEGDDLKEALSAYLEVLYKANPKSIGGSLPADDFYYNDQD